jgi:lipopolysaccharide export system protein LptA
MLNVDQNSGEAEFAGNVLVGQGEMRLSAETVLVVYKSEGKGIERLEAVGNVVLVSGPDAAEAERADYSIDSGLVIMTGNVLLTQGKNALTSDRLEVNLTEGTARMAGRVKTILQPANE